MATYLSPGVYVEEVPSAVQSIAGVGTSTAGFIGVVPNTVTVPFRNPDFDPTRDPTRLPSAVSPPPPGPSAPPPLPDPNAPPPLPDPDAPPSAPAPSAPAVTPSAENPMYAFHDKPFAVTPAGEAVLCTTFAEFTSAFGGFSTDSGQATLAHAVYGFFANGGSRCFVSRILAAGDIAGALSGFEAIDEIAIVAAPGLVDNTSRKAISDHCELMGDRFAILDIDEAPGGAAGLNLKLLSPGTGDILPDNSNYAATYFPWIQVFDPALSLTDPPTHGLRYVAPSGHVAGVYARVDTVRGVHKAPANEVVRGALGLRHRISKAQQDGLNPQGVNVIRDLNGNIRVWGARTVGGDKNGEWKYVNVRRLFLFLRESIDEGTQWVVFEPNDTSLWAKITRNVTAFLTNVWRDGALFGDTPQQAFYVKCDAETNPPEVRDLGRVVTEIGVAVVEPAEFVIFRISQWAGPGG
jgi:uncharacterized protein